MPSIKGRTLDAAAAPIAGLAIEIWQFNHEYGLLPLQTATTDAAGRFSIPFSSFGLLVGGAAEALQVRIKNDVRRLLWKSELFFLTPFGDDKDIGDVTFVANTLGGWRITNFRSDGQHVFYAEKNVVVPLIDAHEAWKEIDDAVAGATKEITLQLFYFDVGHVFLTFNPDPPTIGVPTVGRRLEDLLLVANRASPSVPVRLLIREARDPVAASVSLPYPVHTAREVISFFQAATPNTVAVRAYPTDVRLPMHAKMMTFDAARAHIVGSPLLQEYYDAQTHQLEDPRRGPLSGRQDKGFGSMKNSIRSPIHDVGCKIEGGAAAFIRETFFFHWDLVGPPEGNSVIAPDPAVPNAAVQIARSLPGSTFPNLTEGEMGILEAYLRAFHEAEDYVYLENQYFIEWDILAGIRLALRRAVTNGKPLQFIILINYDLDLPFYNTFQPQRLRQFINEIKTDGNEARVGIFTLFTHEAATPRHKILRTYVHTKLGIADDKWATIGSANLDGVSLKTSDHVMPPTREELEHRRATETNAIVFNGVDGIPGSDVPASLRIRLWSEHLGLVQTDPKLLNRPANGWLSLWRDQAKAKLDGLKADPPSVTSSRVLAWRPQSKTDKFLTQSGVDVSKFDILTEFRSFNFETGNWE
jgi:phosphatidylserine/phosphatidylglycerophosphate/cardiolipin synthase-like enzyme